MIDPQHRQAKPTAWAFLVVLALLLIDASRIAPLIAFIVLLVVVVAVVNIGIGAYRWAGKQRSADK